MALAAIPFFLFLSSFPALATALPDDHYANISAGQRSLQPTNTTTASWRSPSGRFSFGFYQEGAGFRVGIWLETGPRKTIVWTANRDDPPVSSNASLSLTADGLRLQSAGANDKLISDQIVPGSCSYASMLDSGNLVLYNFRNQSIWQSFNSPTDTILGGQTLAADEQLFASASEADHSTGRFRLAMQTDANLVLYPVNATLAYWSTDTFGMFGPILKLHLYESGSLYLINGTGSNMTLVGRQYATEGTFIHRATLDSDGIFRLYSHSPNGSVMRSVDVTGLEGTCRVKGFCGVNSYCELEDGKPNCSCPPGFDFIQPHQQFLGCHRNSSVPSCADSQLKVNITYSIVSVENLLWPDSRPYSFFPMEREACHDECLKDCNCSVALYQDGNCQKLYFPLMYGRKNSTSSSTAFFKVSGLPTAVTDASSAIEPNHGSIHGPGDSRIPVVLLVISIVLAVCLILLLVFSGFLIHIIRGRRYKNVPVDGNLALLDEIAVRSFSYNDLVEVTGNFKEELGRGGFGAVYRGFLHSSGRSVAVKRLEKVIEEGEREFRAEMRAIGRTHHRNLVQLLGFCYEGSSRLLVYEYMSNGSLADLLFKSQIRPEWREREGMALDVARGIHYLHEECRPHIIHCDIKPQNILMDELWTAKISDFGLAKLLMPDQTRTVTMVRGTRGYLAPEWQKNIPISVKTDVYSFGIVLLEIICCRRNIETEVPDDEIILCDWVYNCFLSGQLQKLLGEEEVELRILDRLVKVGLWCIQEEPALRPTMKTVILMMEGNLEAPIPPCPTSSNRSS